MVRRRAAEQPTAVALRRKAPGGETWEDVTTAQFRDEVYALAAGLIAAGVNPGDRVAIMSHTRYEWTLIDYAIWTAGAVTVPIYETSSAEQVEWILSDSGARAVFAETAVHAAIINGVTDRLPALEHVWSIGSLADVVAAGAVISDEDLQQRMGARRAGDLATIIYTSGTTGRP